MSSPLDPFSILNKGQVKAQEPTKKIQRHWPGKQPNTKDADMPIISENSEDEDDDDDIYPEAQDIRSNIGNMSFTSELPKKQHLQESETRTSNQKRRQIVESKVVEEGAEQEEAKEKDIDEQEEQMNDHEDQKMKRQVKQEEEEVADSSRRAKLRARLLQQEESQEQGQPENQQAQPQFVVKEEEEEGDDEAHFENAEEDRERKRKTLIMNQKEQEEQEEEEGIEGQSSDEVEEEERGIISMLKPVYVPSQMREQRDKLLIEDIINKEEKKKREEQKKQEVKDLVTEAIKKDQEQVNIDVEASDAENMPDDNDEIEEAFEYELWKIRELKRLKRDRQATYLREKEQEEIERRRNLTDEQRMEENKKLGSDATDQKEKAKYVFLQKYYHKGAFYQDIDEELLNRDVNLPVGEDLVDKSVLPSCLQKRRGLFGKKGQSKYTHLTDQDTTDYNPQYKNDEQLMMKMFNQQAGLKGANILDRRQLKKIKF